MTSVLLNYEELNGFLAAVYEDTGDPSAAVCQMFVQYRTAMPAAEGDVSARYDQATKAVLLTFIHEDGVRQEIPLAVSPDGPEVDQVTTTFHIRKVCRGVWALAPSLNVPGQLHAYVVLHGVPEPAPWERLILMLDEI
jgi:hypothetical protein